MSGKAWVTLTPQPGGGSLDLFARDRAARKDSARFEIESRFSIVQGPGSALNLDGWTFHPSASWVPWADLFERALPWTAFGLTFRPSAGQLETAFRTNRGVFRAEVHQPFVDVHSPRGERVRLTYVGKFGDDNLEFVSLRLEARDSRVLVLCGFPAVR